MTGDGFPEVVVHNWREYCCYGLLSEQLPLDVSRVPAQPLKLVDKYNSPIGLGSYNLSEVAALDRSLGGPGLVFTETLGQEWTDPCSPVAAHYFHWTGAELVETRVVYSVKPHSNNPNNPLCQFVATNATTSGAIEVLAPLVALQSQLADPHLLVDQARFQLAEYYARIGSADAARSLFQAEADTPDILGDNPYIEASQRFLQAYVTDDDAYRACLQVYACDRSAALQALAAQLWSNGYPTTLDTLQQAGVPVIASGHFDFSEYASDELWFVVQIPGADLPEFWLAARLPEGGQALFVGNVPTTRPILISWVAEAQTRVISLGSELLFTVAHSRDGAEAAVFLYRGHTEDSAASSPTPIAATSTPFDVAVTSFLEVETNLLAGSDPGLAIADLTRMQADLLAGCYAELCAEYYYVLSLAHELAGNDAEAVSSYLTLWSTYPDSGFTIMARAKLELVP